MREHGSENSRNILSDCLVESDPAVRAAGRRTRVASVGASLLLQAAVLTVLIIVPLFAAGKLPMMKFDTPTPIYSGGVSDAPPIQQKGPGGKTHGPRRPPSDFDLTLHQPREIPDRIGDGDSVIAEPHRGGRGCPGCLDIPGSVAAPDIFDGIRRPSLPEMPPPPAPRAPVKVHEKIMESRLIHRVLPVYPVLARQTRTSGSVEMRAIIGRDGRVHSLEVISGHALLIQAAVDAVRQWRYTPTLLNGEPVEVDTFVTVKFILSQ